ncbi:hypothetical protein [Streptomyces sp. NPDC020917]
MGIPGVLLTVFMVNCELVRATAGRPVISAMEKRSKTAEGRQVDS